MFIMSSYFKGSFHVFSHSHRMFMTFQIHFMAKNHHSSPFIDSSSFIWSGSRRHQVYGLPLFTIANLLVLSKFYIHYIHWIWLLNCSIWSYHDFFRTTSRLFFQKILCFATPMERNIDSRTSTLALASQQFPRFVGWRFYKSEAGQGDVRFTIDSLNPPDCQVFWSKSSLRAWLTCAFYES